MNERESLTDAREDGQACTKRDHVVRGGIDPPGDIRKYRCECGLVLVTGTGVVEIRFGLLDRLYPEDTA